jgi:hypothetical protein
VANCISSTPRADLRVARFYRETWCGSLEMALQSLLQLQMPLPRAIMAVAKFCDHDHALLKR